MKHIYTLRNSPTFRLTPLPHREAPYAPEINALARALLSSTTSSEAKRLCDAISTLQLATSDPRATTLHSKPLTAVCLYNALHIAHEHIL